MTRSTLLKALQVSGLDQCRLSVVSEAKTLVPCMFMWLQ